MYVNGSKIDFQLDKYSMSVRFGITSFFNEKNIDVRLSFSALNLVLGQMETVGNGIHEIGCSFSVNEIVTSFSLHAIQMLRIFEVHQPIDTAMANIQNRRSVQCRFRSVKYRIPWTVLWSQNSLTNRRILNYLNVFDWRNRYDLEKWTILSWFNFKNDFCWEPTSM